MSKWHLSHGVSNEGGSTLEMGPGGVNRVGRADDETSANGASSPRSPPCVFNMPYAIDLQKVSGCDRSTI